MIYQTAVPSYHYLNHVPLHVQNLFKRLLQGSRLHRDIFLKLLPKRESKTKERKKSRHQKAAVHITLFEIFLKRRRIFADVLENHSSL